MSVPENSTKKVKVILRLFPLANRTYLFFFLQRVDFLKIKIDNYREITLEKKKRDFDEIIVVFHRTFETNGYGNNSKCSSNT